MTKRLSNHRVLLRLRFLEGKKHQGALSKYKMKAEWKEILNYSIF